MQFVRGHLLISVMLLCWSYTWFQDLLCWSDCDWPCGRCASLYFVDICQPAVSSSLVHLSLDLVILTSISSCETVNAKAQCCIWLNGLRRYTVCSHVVYNLVFTACIFSVNFATRRANWTIYYAIFVLFVFCNTLNIKIWSTSCDSWIIDGWWVIVSHYVNRTSIVVSY
jgi:hypothetical protein